MILLGLKYGFPTTYASAYKSIMHLYPVVLERPPVFYAFPLASGPLVHLPPKVVVNNNNVYIKTLPLG